MLILFWLAKIVICGLKRQLVSQLKCQIHQRTWSWTIILPVHLHFFSCWGKEVTVSICYSSSTTKVTEHRTDFVCIRLNEYLHDKNCMVMDSEMGHKYDSREVSLNTVRKTPPYVSGGSQESFLLYIQYIQYNCFRCALVHKSVKRQTSGIGFTGFKCKCFPACLFHTLFHCPFIHRMWVH